MAIRLSQKYYDDLAKRKVVTPTIAVTPSTGIRLSQKYYDALPPKKVVTPTVRPVTPVRNNTQPVYVNVVKNGSIVTPKVTKPPVANKPPVMNNTQPRYVNVVKPVAPVKNNGYAYNPLNVSPMGGDVAPSIFEPRAVTAPVVIKKPPVDIEAEKFRSNLTHTQQKLADETQKLVNFSVDTPKDVEKKANLTREVANLQVELSANTADLKSYLIPKKYENVKRGTTSIETWNANIDVATLSKDKSKAMTNALDDPTPQNIKLADTLNKTYNEYITKNRNAMYNTDGTLRGNVITRVFASAVPGILDMIGSQIPAQVAAAAIGVATGGAGYVPAQQLLGALAAGKNTYEYSKGSTYNDLISLGVSADKAKAISSNEAFGSTLLTLATYAVGYKMLGFGAVTSSVARLGTGVVADLIAKPGEELIVQSTLQKIIATLAKYGVFVLTGSAAGAAQQGLTVAGQKEGLGSARTVTARQDLESEIAAAISGAQTAAIFGGLTMAATAYFTPRVVAPYGKPITPNAGETGMTVLPQNALTPSMPNIPTMGQLVPRVNTISPVTNPIAPIAPPVNTTVKPITTPVNKPIVNPTQPVEKTFVQKMNEVDNSYQNNSITEEQYISQKQEIITVESNKLQSQKQELKNKPATTPTTAPAVITSNNATVTTPVTTLPLTNTVAPKVVETPSEGQITGVETPVKIVKDSTGNSVTPEQSEYFKDSKIKDSEGNLIRVYHGTSKDFNQFDTKMSPQFFTPYKEYAESYSKKIEFGKDIKKDSTNKQGIVKELFLNITKPFDTRDQEALDIFNNEYATYRANRGREAVRIDGPKMLNFVYADDLYPFLTRMKREGKLNYDGIVVDEATGTYTPSYVPLLDSQIKSVDNKSPTNSPNLMEPTPSPAVLEKISIAKTEQTKSKSPATVQASIAKPVMPALKNNLPFNTSKTDSITKRSEIESFISDTLDIPVSQGKFRERAWGIFKVQPEVIRLKATKDLPTLFHETGHFLDKKFKLSTTTDPAIDAELMKLGQPVSKKTYSDEKVKGEGLAEFVRNYLFNEQKAKSIAPELYKKFRGMLNGDVTLDNMMKTVQKATDNYRSQTPEQRILSNISVGQKDKGPGMSLDRLYSLIYDDLDPFNKVVKQITGGTKISPNDNPYDLATLYHSAAGRAETYLKYGIVDENFNKIGDSLTDILGKVDNLDDFRAYIIAKRAKELGFRGIKTGMGEVDVDVVIKNHEAKYLGTFKKLVEFQDSILQQQVTQGMLSQENYEAIKRLNKDYIPMNRVMDAFKKFGNGKGSQATQLVKGIKGSTLDVIDPLESIIRNTFALTNMAERNRVMLAFRELTLNYEGTGKFLEQVPPPMKGQSFQLGEIQNILSGAGIDVAMLENVDMQQIATIFRPTGYSSKDNIIVIFSEGKPEYYEVHDELLYRAFTAMDKVSSGPIIKLMSFPAKVLRTGAVLNPDFMARNPTRDALSAFIFSRYGFVPGVDTVRGLFHVIGKDDLYYKCLASGGLQSSLVSMDRDYLQKNLKQVLAENKGDKVLNILKNPMDSLRALGEFTEEATRVGEFALGVKKEGSNAAGIRKAALSSRDVTIDFGRGGPWSREANKVIAFFNAGLQGPDKLVRAFKEAPVRTTMKILMAITLPSILLYMRNRKDPRYEELPAWEKDLFWIILTKDKIYRIPKPFEVGLIFGSLFERVLKWVEDDDPTALDGFANSLVESLVPGIPPIPNAILPMVEAMTNHSFFKGYAIVPDSQKYLAPWQQYSQYTSETAKLIGKALNISPRIVENTIYGYGAGLAQYGVDVVDVVLKLSGLVESKIAPPSTVENLPVIKGFMAVAYQNSDSINEFYNLRAKLSTSGNEDTKTKAQLKDLNHKADLLTQLRKEINSVYDSKVYTDEKKKTLIDAKTIQMVNLARLALGKELIK